MAYTLAQLQAMGAKPTTAPQKSYTLAELQAAGAKPVAASAAPLPAPKPKKPLADLVPHFKYNPEDGTKPAKIVGKAIANIPHETATAVSNIVKLPIETYKTVTDPSVRANPGAALKGFGQGLYENFGKPVLGATVGLGRTIQGVTQEGIKNVTGVNIGDKAAAEAYKNILPNAISAVEGLQRGLVENPLATAYGTAEGVRFARGLPRGTDAVSSMARPVIDATKTATKPITAPIKAARQNALIQKTAGEIAAVESKYAKGRKAAKYSKDAGVASRERVAKSAVLKDAVGTDGKISTSQKGGPIDQYRAAHVAPYESLVRELLVKEGAKISIKEAEAYLLKTIRESAITGKELPAAIRNVKKEMAGYALKADAQGRIPLEILHDAKIATTPKGAKFLTPPDVQAYNKTLGRGLKEIVENYSKQNVKGINADLSKFYTDIALLERLDGSLVQGGKLGKYTAQITGNIAGGIAGSAFGPLGSAVGTVVGGEVSSAMKGAAMGRTFGGVVENSLKRSPILEKAAADAKAPRLMLPEATGQFRSEIYSGPTIQLPAGERPTSRALPAKSGISSETQLSQQSVTLPKATTPESVTQPINRNRGFARIGGAAEAPKSPTKSQFGSFSKSTLHDAVAKELSTYDATPLTVRGKSNRVSYDADARLDQLKQLSEQKALTDAQVIEGYNLLKKKGIDAMTADTMGKPALPKGISKDLAAEAKKYKSAEEFVKAQGKPLYHGSPKADIIRKEGFKLPKTMAERTDAPVYGDGVYFSTKKSGAYDTTHSGVNTVEGYIPKDVRLYPATEKDMFSLKTEVLKKQGYDGVDVSLGSGEHHVTVFDPTVIKTKEQLFSIYDKVHGTQTEMIPTILKPLYTLARTTKSSTDFIAQAKLNGNIAQTLGERFNGSGIEAKLTDLWNKVNNK